MKKKLYFYSMMLLLLSGFNSFANPPIDKTSQSTPEVKLTEAEQKIRVQQLELRVQEIKAMDKSRLSFQERRALRKEIYQIKKEMKGFTSGGVYLSVAAIVIIILVLILIL